MSKETKTRIAVSPLEGDVVKALMGNGLALAKRAVACEHFHWMRGMRAVGCISFHGADVYGSYTVDAVFADLGSAPMPVTMAKRCRKSHEWLVIMHALPDLSESAVLGCLLTMVRRACQDDAIYVYPYEGTWGVCANGGLIGDKRYPTEVEALIAMLEAKP